MSPFVVWVGLYVAAHIPMMVATQEDNVAHPPSLSTDPPCSKGQQWSSSSGQCCPLCAAGTGATGACVDPAVTGHGSSDSDGMSVTESSSNNISSNSSERTLANGCQVCTEGQTFSATHSHTDQPCRACSTCPKHARVVRPCNSTQDTLCECEVGLFYLSERSGQCQLCDLCPAGWGARQSCGGYSNTACHKCVNGTYSDVLSATAPCRPCATCGEGQKMLQACSATGDTMCISKYMDIPPMYRFNGNSGGSHPHDLDLAHDHINADDAKRRQNRAKNEVDDDDDGIDVIPLYCAALGAVVVGLLAYVAFVHYRRMRDKRLSREPHEDVEYSKASAGADSGVFVDPDHPHHHQQNRYQSAVITGSTRLRDVSPTKKKELEKTYLAGSRGPADWKGLARELGYNSGKIASFESRGGSQRDPGALYRLVMQDWSRLEGATVAALLRALRNTGRHDVVKFLQAECAEQLQPLTATLPQHVV